MATVDQLLKVGARTATLRVPTDGGAAEQTLKEARAARTQAIVNGRDTAEADKAIAKAEKAADKAAVVICLRGVSRRVYRELEVAHPATDAQRDAATAANQPTPVRNDDTFGPALVAASVTDPDLTYDQAVELFDVWTPGDIAALLNTALNLAERPQVGVAGKR